MAKTKKPGGLAKVSGKITVVVGIITTLSQVITPEMMGRVVSWLQQQRFSDKFVELIKEIHAPDGKNPLERIGHQCDAVEELIATRSADLADSAPIGEWRGELDKIRRGVELIDSASERDRKKIKSLERRAKGLFDSVFTAAVN
jgi:hypothetical protein